jgi:hypothetical protein
MRLRRSSNGVPAHRDDGRNGTAREWSPAQGGPSGPGSAQANLGEAVS